MVGQFFLWGEGAGAPPKFNVGAHSPRMGPERRATPPTRRARPGRRVLPGCQGRGTEAKSTPPPQAPRSTLLPPHAVDLLEGLGAHLGVSDGVHDVPMP